MISTAPVFVAGKKATVVSATTPRPFPRVTSYSEIESAASPSVIPSVSERSRGTARNRVALNAPPSNLPRIIAINISEVNIHSGDKMSGDIRTTPNVKTVEIRIEGWGMPIPRQRPGLFAMSGQIPQLPFFVKGNYTLQVIARNASGLYTERDIPISLR